MKKQILVIGAGPYGIALANELWNRGIDFTLVGIPFELWHEHTFHHSSLRSDRHTSEVSDPENRYTLSEYLRRTSPTETSLRGRIPIDLFRAYLKDVEKRLPYPLVRQKVTTLSAVPEGFTAVLSDGEELLFRRVVVAAGIGAHRYLPSVLSHLTREKVVHSWDVQDLGAWTGLNILVVGAGQSAGESVAHLSKNNKVTWVRARPPVYYSEPLDLPKPIFKAILQVSPFFYFLPSYVKKIFGKKFVISTITPDLQPVLESQEVVRITARVEELNMEEDKKSPFDVILACTGYRYHLNNLSFLSGDLKRRVKAVQGVPDLDFNFESSVAGLHFVGGIAEPSYGPAQRFMMGAEHAARRLGKHFC
ncbi:MAG: SidA/IucD/PvdA family monooxygenase [Spirochaetales bacterium]|nr:SidA/IucD/PvdA family monooxygenase [Spirochaetales bacterium]